MQAAPSPHSRPMMTIQESVMTCLRKYADFSGRATRAEFWWWVLATAIASVAINAIETFASAIGGIFEYSPFGAIFSLAILLPNLAVSARRLHDIGKSGWWLLVWIGSAIVGAVPLGIGVAYTIISVFSGNSWWGHPEFWIPIIIGAAVSVLVWIGLFIWCLLWMATQGRAGANRYGQDPRAWTGSEVVAA